MDSSASFANSVIVLHDRRSLFPYSRTVGGMLARQRCRYCSENFHSFRPQLALSSLIGHKVRRRFPLVCSVISFGASFSLFLAQMPAGFDGFHSADFWLFAALHKPCYCLTMGPIRRRTRWRWKTREIRTTAWNSSILGIEAQSEA